jgi:hypothetical protein
MEVQVIERISGIEVTVFPVLMILELMIFAVQSISVVLIVLILWIFWVLNVLILSVAVLVMNNPSVCGQIRFQSGS